MGDRTTGIYSPESTLCHPRNGMAGTLPVLRVLSLVSNQTVMGASKVVMEFCSQCSTAGMTCLPVCIVRGRQDTNECAEAFQEAGIQCERMHERSGFDPGAFVELVRILRRFRPDVVEAHGHREFLYAAAARTVSRFRIVTYFHGWSETSPWTREDSSLCVMLLRLSPVVITVCEDFKNRLRRRGVCAARVHVIRNGINPDLYRNIKAEGNLRADLGIGQGERVLAVIGRLSREKGQEFFLRAFSQVVGKRSDVRALVVGDGPDLEKLQGMAARLGLTGKIIFTGYRREVRRVYETIGALVVPSLSEGIPNVVLEAMSFGVPVVATRVGGIPEMIEDGRTGVLVPARNPDQMAAAIVRLLDDPAFARQIAQAARRQVAEKFSTRARCVEVARLYRALVGMRVSSAGWIA